MSKVTLESVAAEFRSGNSVPVERATLTRERMQEALEAYARAAIEAYMRKIQRQTTTAPVYVSRSMLNAARRHGAAIGATIYGQQQDSSAGEMVALYEGQK